MNCILDNCNNLHQKNIEFKREISKIVGEFNNNINNNYSKFIYNELKERDYRKKMGGELLKFYDNFYILMKDYFANIKQYSKCILNNCNAQTYFEILYKHNKFTDHFYKELNEMIEIMRTNKRVIVGNKEGKMYENKLLKIRNLIEDNVRKLLILRG
jgi:hypothetical protein